ncbi:MAG: hypothetical protein P9L88_01565, partial [Candidatus Tantalella remota]|nr:hypothetical protein [Candidatus Tantalella remota]
MKAWRSIKEKKTVLPIPNLNEVPDISGISTFKNRHMRIIKVIAVIVIAIFTHQQLVWAQGGEALLGNVVKGTKNQYDYNNYVAEGEIEVPYDVAKAGDKYYNGGSETVIQVQDAHASLDAQYSIVTLLDSLVTNYDLQLIALEGAKGYIDTSVLKTFPNKEIRENTADFLMREGRMSAGEFFEITRDNNVRIYGVEDEELYQQNVKSFCAVAENRAALIGDVEAFEAQIRALEGKVYSPRLRDLATKSRLHVQGELGFAEYWKEISSLIDSFSIDTGSYSQLSILTEAIELEKGIDFAKANAERKSLIDELSERMEKSELEGLVLRSVQFKENKISQSSFHSYLRTLAEKYEVSDAGYKNLINFTTYISLYESIDIFGLYHDMAVLEEELCSSLYRNDDERALYKAARDTAMLKRLYSVELTNGDYDYIVSVRADYDSRKIASLVKDQCAKYDVQIIGGYDLDNMLSSMDEALEFYRVAKQRDNVMLSNTVSRMRSEGVNVAALITGGYHTRGLTKLMKEKGLSYLVVIPKFTEGEERPYIAILTNKKKPYQKLLDSGKYNLAVEAYFYSAKGDLTRMKSALFHALGEAALRGEDVVAIKKLWASTYRSRYENVTSIRKNDMTFEPITPEEFEDFLTSRVDVRRVGDAAVIADKTEEGVSFITLARKGDTLEFNAASKAQRKTFMAKTGMREELESLQAEVTDIKDMLTSFVDNREQLIFRIDASIPAIVEELKSGKMDDAGITQAVEAKLKAKGLPQSWQKDPELSAAVEDAVIKVSDARFLMLTPYELNRAHIERVMDFFDVLWPMGDASGHEAELAHYRKIMHEFIIAHAIGSSYGSPEMATLDKPVDDSYGVLQANNITLSKEADILLADSVFRNKQATLDRIASSDLTPEGKEWLKRMYMYFIIADSLEMGADYLRAVRVPELKGNNTRTPAPADKTFATFINDPSKWGISLSENLNIADLEAVTRALTAASSEEYALIRAIADRAAASVDLPEAVIQEDKKDVTETGKVEGGSDAAGVPGEGIAGGRPVVEPEETQKTETAAAEEKDTNKRGRLNSTGAVMVMAVGVFFMISGLVSIGYILAASGALYAADQSRIYTGKKPVMDRILGATKAGSHVMVRNLVNYFKDPRSVEVIRLENLEAISARMEETLAEMKKNLEKAPEDEKIIKRLRKAVSKTEKRLGKVNASIRDLETRIGMMSAAARSAAVLESKVAAEMPSFEDTGLSENTIRRRIGLLSANGIPVNADTIRLSEKRILEEAAENFILEMTPTNVTEAELQELADLIRNEILIFRVNGQTIDINDWNDLYADDVQIKLKGLSLSSQEEAEIFRVIELRKKYAQQLTLIENFNLINEDAIREELYGVYGPKDKVATAEFNDAVAEAIREEKEDRREELSRFFQEFEPGMPGVISGTLSDLMVRVPEDSAKRFREITHKLMTSGFSNDESAAEELYRVFETVAKRKMATKVKVIRAIAKEDLDASGRDKKLNRAEQKELDKLVESKGSLGVREAGRYIALHYRWLATQELNAKGVARAKKVKAREIKGLASRIASGEAFEVIGNSVMKRAAEGRLSANRIERVFKLFDAAQKSVRADRSVFYRAYDAMKNYIAQPDAVTLSLLNNSLEGTEHNPIYRKEAKLFEKWTDVYVLRAMGRKIPKLNVGEELDIKKMREELGEKGMAEFKKTLAALRKLFPKAVPYSYISNGVMSDKVIDRIKEFLTQAKENYMARKARLAEFGRMPVFGNMSEPARNAMAIIIGILILLPIALLAMCTTNAPQVPEYQAEGTSFDSPYFMSAGDGVMDVTLENIYMDAADLGQLAQNEAELSPVIEAVAGNMAETLGFIQSADAGIALTNAERATLHFMVKDLESNLGVPEDGTLDTNSVEVLAGAIDTDAGVTNAFERLGEEVQAISDRSEQADENEVILLAQARAAGTNAVLSDVDVEARPVLAPYKIVDMFDKVTIEEVEKLMKVKGGFRIIWRFWGGTMEQADEAAFKSMILLSQSDDAGVQKKAYKMGMRAIEWMQGQDEDIIRYRFYEFILQEAYNLSKDENYTGDLEFDVAEMLKELEYLPEDGTHGKIREDLFAKGQLSQQDAMVAALTADNLLDDELQVYHTMINYLKENATRGITGNFKVWLAFAYDTEAGALGLTLPGMSTRLLDRGKDAKVNEARANIGNPRAEYYSSSVEALKSFLVNWQEAHQLTEEIAKWDQGRAGLEDALHHAREDERFSIQARINRAKGRMIDQQARLAVIEGRLKKIMGLDPSVEVTFDFLKPFSDESIDAAYSACAERGIKLGVPAEVIRSDAAAIWAEARAAQADVKGIKTVDASLSLSLLNILESGPMMFSGRINIKWGKVISDAHADFLRTVKKMYAETSKEDARVTKSTLREMEMSAEALLAAFDGHLEILESMKKQNQAAPKMWSKDTYDLLQIIFDIRHTTNLRNEVERQLSYIKAQLIEYGETVEWAEKAEAMDSAAIVTNILARQESRGGIAELKALKIKADAEYKRASRVMNRLPIGLSDGISLGTSFQPGEEVTATYGWTEYSENRSDITTWSTSFGITITMDNALGLWKKYWKLTGEESALIVKHKLYGWTCDVLGMVNNYRSLREQLGSAQKQLELSQQKLAEVQSDKRAMAQEVSATAIEVTKAEEFVREKELDLERVRAQLSRAVVADLEGISDPGMMDIDEIEKLMTDALVRIKAEGYDPAAAEKKLLEMSRDKMVTLLRLARWKKMEIPVTLAWQEYKKQTTARENVTDDSGTPIINPLTGDPFTDNVEDADGNSVSTEVSETSERYSINWVNTLDNLVKRYGSVRRARAKLNISNFDLEAWPLQAHRVRELAEGNHSRATLKLQSVKMELEEQIGILASLEEKLKGNDPDTTPRMVIDQRKKVEGLRGENIAAIAAVSNARLQLLRIAGPGMNALAVEKPEEMDIARRKVDLEKQVIAVKEMTALLETITGYLDVDQEYSIETPSVDDRIDECDAYLTEIAGWRHYLDNNGQAGYNWDYDGPTFPDLPDDASIQDRLDQQDAINANDATQAETQAANDRSARAQLDYYEGLLEAKKAHYEDIKSKQIGGIVDWKLEIKVRPFAMLEKSGKTNLKRKDAAAEIRQLEQAYAFRIQRDHAVVRMLQEKLANERAFEARLNEFMRT